MPEWLGICLKFLVVEFPKVLKQNLIRTVLCTVLVTLLIQAAFLNPIFGSTRLKAKLIQLVISDSDEVAHLIKYIDRSEIQNRNFIFQRGAAGAGYYKTSDIGLISEWEQESQALTWDYGAKQKNMTALLKARSRAETLLPPFQIIGRKATGSSPDCHDDRPEFNEIFVDPTRDLGRMVRHGVNVKIVNINGGGIPVIAKVVHARKTLPESTDFYLNKVQMNDMLRQKGEYADLKLNITNESPNQDVQDNYPEPAFCR
jgi:hypothetical protein